MKLCIDLCSGLGGFSAAFKDSPDWEVITVDINPKFNPTICADITKLDIKEIESATKLLAFKNYEKLVVMASPPCERFSIANSDWPQRGIGKALQIVGACIELIIAIKPTFYALENPKGRLRWFIGAPPHSVRLSDYGHRTGIQGGKNRRTFKPTDLWTNIPFPLVEADIMPEIKKGETYKASSKRALMPYKLSQAVLEAASEK